MHEESIKEPSVGAQQSMKESFPQAMLPVCLTIKWRGFGMRRGMTISMIIIQGESVHIAI